MGTKGGRERRNYSPNNVLRGADGWIGILHLSALEDDGLEYDIAFDAVTTSVERSEVEQSMMDKYHPVWYSGRQGYHGTNIDTLWGRLYVHSKPSVRTALHLYPPTSHPSTGSNGRQ